jgi:hypothetical protein
MPRGLIRYEHTGNFHFLTFSCYHRLQHLGAAYATHCLGVVQIESQWTAMRRGNRLPECLRYREKAG